MTQNVWGFDWTKVQEMQVDEPQTGRFLFRCTFCKSGVNKKGKPFVNFGAKVEKVISGDPSDLGKVKWEYLSLEPERVGFTKAFLTNIGAGQALATNRGPQDVIGTTFEADVVSVMDSKGVERRNLRNLKAVGFAKGAPPEPIRPPIPDEDVPVGDDGISEDEILAMSSEELDEFVESNGLNIDLESYKSLTARKKAVVALLREETPPEPPKPTTGKRLGIVPRK